MKGRQPIGGGDSWELRVRASDFRSEDHEMPLHILEPLERPPGHRARERGAVSGEEAEQASRALLPPVLLFHARDSPRGRMDSSTFIRVFNSSYWIKCVENVSLLTLTDFRTQDRLTRRNQRKKETGLLDASGGHTSLGCGNLITLTLCRLRFVS